MSDSNRYWDRRKFVGTGAGGLAAILAGCASVSNGGDSSGEQPTMGSGSDSNDSAGTGSEDGGSGGGSLMESRFDFVGGRTPTDVQMNLWNLANFGHTYHIYWSTPIATAYADGSISSDYLEDMTADGNELALTFPDGWTYWNGRDLTAEDFYVQLEIERFQDPEASQFESVELTDDSTVTATFKNEVTPNLMKAAMVGKYQITPRWIYNEYLTRYQEASGSDERESITEELLQMTIPVQQFVDDGLGNGLYQIDSFGSAETLASKYEDHPYADRTNIPETRVIPVGDNTESLATNNELDRVSWIRERQRQQYPEDLQNQQQIQWFRAQKFILNWTNPHLANRSVRRALVSAIDLQSITAAARRYIAEPTQVQTGLRSSIHDQYLGSDFADQLIKYPVESDPETAASYMEQAGYSQQNGTWTSPDGETVSLNILTRTQTGQAQPTQVMSDQLNTFGIETNVNAVGENYYTKLQEWDFDMGWVWHVARPLWHPVSYFSNDFYGVKADDVGSSGPGPTGVPDTVTIPEEVGAEEVSGSGVEFNPAQLMNELPSSTSQDQVVERTRTLSQWFNYDLPAIIYMQENTGYAGDSANFDFPGDDKKLDTNYPGRVAWMKGWISGKTG